MRIVQNFLSLAAAEGVVKFCNFFAVVYLARLFTPTGFGKLSFASAVISYFVIFANFGLETFGIRQIARKIDAERYFNNIITIRLLLSVAAFLTLLIFLYFLPQENHSKKLILYFGFTLFSNALLIEWVFAGLEKMKFIAISKIGRQLVYLALIFYLIKSYEQVMAVPLLLFISQIVPVVLLFLLIKSRFNIGLRFDMPLWKEIFKGSVPIGLSIVMVQVYDNFDAVMLGFMKGPMSVGLYSACYKIMLLFIALRMVITQVIFPRFSYYYKLSSDKLSRFSVIVEKLSIVFILPFICIGIFFAGDMIKFIYGESYLVAVNPLRILLLAAGVVYVNTIFPGILNACDRQRLYLKMTFCGMVTNLALNIILIPRFGLTGAAFATLTAFLVTLSLSYRMSKGAVDIAIIPLLVKPFIALGIMSVVLAAFRGLVSVIVMSVIGLAVYISVILSLKYIKYKELRFIGDLSR